MARRAVRSAAFAAALIGVTPSGAAGRINVTGNERLGADVIQAYFHPGEGGKFNDADLDPAVKRMYGSSQFGDVRMSRDGEIVIVHVEESLRALPGVDSRATTASRTSDRCQSRWRWR